MAEPLEQTLTLDMSDALARVDVLESRLLEAADAAGAGFHDAISAAVEEAGGAGTQIGALIASGIIEGGSTGIAALQEQISALTGEVQVTIDPIDPNEAVAQIGTVEVPVEADTSSFDAIVDGLAIEPIDVAVNTSEFDTIAAALDAAPDTVGVTVEVDASQVEAVLPEVEGLEGTAVITVEVDDDQVQAVDQVLRNWAGEIVEAPFSVDTSGIDAAENKLAELPTEISVELSVDPTALEEVSAAPIEVEATVDTSALGEASLDVEALRSQASEVPTVTVEADTNAVRTATEEVEELGNAVNAASGTVLNEVFGGGADPGGDILNTASSISLLSGGVDSLETSIGGLNPTLSALVTGAASVGIGLKVAVDEAATAESAAKRLNDVLGEQADRFLNLDGSIAGFTGSISDLALATGSSDDGLVLAGANFADLGKQAGFSNEQVAQTSQELAVLASYVAATRPQLGTADEIAAKLSTTLQRGGRFAQQMGLDIGTAGDISERAADLFGKNADEVTGYERSVAGLTIAYENLGDRIGPAIAGAADDPIIALRLLQTRLGEVAEAAGGEVLGPLLQSLDDLAPAAEAVGSIFGSVTSGAFAILGPEIRLLGNILTLTSDILENDFVRGLLAGAGAGAVIYRSLKVITDLKNQVTDVFSGLGRAAAAVSGGASVDEVGAAFRNTTTAATQASVAAAQVEVSYATLQGSLAAARAEAVIGSESWQVLTAAQTANALAAIEQTAAYEARLLVTEKQIAVGIAEAAAERGDAVSTQALVAAKAELALAETAATVASERAAAAQTGAAAANAAAAATQEGAAAGVAVASAEAAASVTVLGVAEEGLAASTAATSSVMAAANPIILALTLALGVAFAAYTIFGGGADETSKQVVAATDAIGDYGDALSIVGEQLANSSQVDLARQFQRAKEAATDAKAAITDAIDEGAVQTVEQYGISWQRVGEAIRGSRDAQRDVRTQLVTQGGANEADVRIGDLSTEQLASANIGEARDAIQAVRDAVIAEYQRSGDSEAAAAAGVKVGESYSKAIRQQIGFAQGGVPQVRLDLGLAGEEIEAQIAAQEKAEENLARQAAAEIKAGDATNVANLTYLAQIGALDRLDPKLREAADGLLREAEAAERTTAAQAVLAGITDETTRSLARQAFAAQAAIEAGDAPSRAGVAAARALQASDGFNQLDESVQEATLATLEYADAAIQTARENGDLVSSTGELAFGMSELRDQLDSAADGFVNMLSRAQGMGAATRDVNKLLDELVPTAKKLGTTIDETSASFDVGSITADNYTEYLRLLPKRVQDAIEGRNQAVEAAEQKRKKAADETDKGASLIAIRFSAGEFIGGIEADGGDTKADKEKKSAEQKAAETRAAIAASGDALDTVGRQARQNTRDLADFFDELGIAIRKEAAEMLKSGDSVDVVTRKIAERRTEFIRQAREAGFTNDKILELLGNERLLPDQVSIDLRESGVDKVVDAIERLGLVLSGLAEIDPEVLRRIQGIQDPTKQIEEFNDAIAKLPREQQVKLRALFNVPETEVAAREAAESAQRAADQQSAIELSVIGKADLDSALIAGDEIAAVIATIPLDVPIHVTADTVDAVAEFDAVTDPRRKELEAIIAAEADPTKKKAAQDELDRIAKSRDALIQALIAPGSLDAATLELAQWAASQTLHFKAVVDEVTLPPGTPGTQETNGLGRPTPDTRNPPQPGPAPAGGGSGSTNGQGRPTPDSRNAPQSSAYDRAIAEAKRVVADLPAQPYTTVENNQGLPYRIEQLKQSLQANPNDPAAFLELINRMQVRGARVPGFAAGGTTANPDEISKRLKAQQQALAVPGLAEPGLYPPTEFRFAEPSTQGEYLISRDPQYRDRNQALIQTAAADLGVRLPSAPSAPSIVIDRPSIVRPDAAGNSDLTAVLAQLAGAVAGGRLGGADGSGQPEGRPGVNIEHLTVQAPDPDLRTSRSVIEDVRTAVFTAR